ncbi:MAG: DUF1080 domain-containing protein [Planctomycetes bacterium]|nr:DUF1080 domain-containing protein [Planctomycetota bacterium]
MRETIWTSRGETGWTKILDGKRVEDFKHAGAWTLANGALSAEKPAQHAALDICPAIGGDFEFACGMTTIAGGNGSILFRCSEDGKQSYELDLMYGMQAVVLKKHDRTKPQSRTILSAVNHELRQGTEYAVELAVRGESITTYVNGKLVNQVREAEFAAGDLKLYSWQSNIRYADPRVRIY